MSPQVHIVDDDPAIRDSLQFLFASCGVPAASYESAEAFLQAPWSEFNGCILADIRMTGMSGLDLFDVLQARGCNLPILFLTGHGEVPMAVDALKKGAFDFLEKPFDERVLQARVHAALAIAATRVDLARRRASLSSRERDVMERLLEGRMNKIIADDLGITMRTVEVHRARVFEKMGVRSAVELAQLLARGR